MINFKLFFCSSLVSNNRIEWTSFHHHDNARIYVRQILNSKSMFPLKWIIYTWVNYSSNWVLVRRSWKQELNCTSKLFIEIVLIYIFIIWFALQQMNFCLIIDLPFCILSHEFIFYQFKNVLVCTIFSKNEKQYEMKTCMRLELSTNEQVKEGD